MESVAKRINQQLAACFYGPLLSWGKLDISSNYQNSQVFIRFSIFPIGDFQVHSELPQKLEVQTGSVYQS